MADFRFKKILKIFICYCFMINLEKVFTYKAAKEFNWGKNYD